MKAFALNVITVCLLALSVFSCKKDSPAIEDQLIGKWKLTEKTSGNIPVVLTDCEKQNSIEFQANNFCLLFDSCSDATINSGWNYKYEMLNISEHLPAAYYIVQLDATTLKIRRNDISADGSLLVTLLTYVKIGTVPGNI